MARDNSRQLAAILTEIGECEARLDELRLRAKDLFRDVAPDFGFRVSNAVVRTEKPSVSPSSKTAEPGKVTAYDRTVAAVRALGKGRLADVLAHLEQTGGTIPKNSARTYLTRAAKVGDLVKVAGDDGLYEAPHTKAKQTTLDEQTESSDE